MQGTHGHQEIMQQNKPGFIYIYTYSNLFESYISEKTVDLKWLFIDESIIRTNGKKKRQWVDRDFILCKIGMTTRKTVDSRLLEWQTTCKHPVINLTPEKVDKLYHLKLKSESKNISSNRLLPISLSSLQKKMEKLFIKDKSHSHKPSLPDPKVPTLRTYKDGGFFISGKGSMKLPDIESAIHKFLWKKYGKGLVYCYGCDPTGKKRHTEWFNVPVLELPSVLRLMILIALEENLVRLKKNFLAYSGGLFKLFIIIKIVVLPFFSLNYL